MADAAGGAAAASAAAVAPGRPTRRPSATTATTTATHDDDAGERDEGDLMGWWGEGAGAGGETFRQIPINALMDHNDDVRRVCDDFTRALRCVGGHCLRSRCGVAALRRCGVYICRDQITLTDTHNPLHSSIHSIIQPTNRIHAAEEERMSAGIYRASQSAARAAAVDPSMAAPADQPSAPSGSTPGAGTTGEGEMPSIGAALLAFRCVTSLLFLVTHWYILRTFRCLMSWLNTQGLPLLAGAGPRALRPEHDRRGARTPSISDMLWPLYHRNRITS